MIFNNKPFIGILAFIIVLFVMPIGRTVMILKEKLFGEQYMFPAATILGIIGEILLWIGFRDKTETTATWIGNKF